MSLFNRMFQGLHGKTSPIAPQPRPQGMGRESISMDSMMQNDYKTAHALTAMFTAGANSRKEFIKHFSEVKAFYIVDAILDLLAEDSLTPDATTNEIVELSSDDPEVDAHLKQLQDRIDLDSLVNDITLDLLGFGEYTLRMDVQPNVGVTEVIDDVVQENTIVFYRKGLPYVFMQKHGNGFSVSPPTEFAHFTLGNRKLRLNLDKEFGTSGRGKKLILPDGLPTYVRIGRPILYGTLSKIKELQLLEALIPAAKLAQISSGNIVGVDVPPSTSPEDGLRIVKKYEQLLNKKVGIDPVEDDISVANILTTAGKTKVIPIFGDKGSLQNIDAKDNRNVDDLLNTVQDTREVICSAIGVPSELLFGGEGPKSEVLKKYARYIRKLKSIQTAVAAGLKQIALAHVVNQEVPVHAKITDIKVNFRNVLINIDELDKLEFSVALVESVKQMNEFVLGMEESPALNDIINVDKYKEFIRRQLAFINQGVDFIDSEEDSEEEETSDVIIPPEFGEDLSENK